MNKLIAMPSPIKEYPTAVLLIKVNTGICDAPKVPNKNKLTPALRSHNPVLAQVSFLYKK